MDLLIFNGNILTPDGVIENGWLFLKGGKIDKVGKGTPKRLATAEAIDARGCFVSPGFIDLQIYGEAARIAQEEAKYGTTGFLATLGCGSSREILREIDGVLESIRSQRGGARILGIHLEGPYLNKKEAGAQSKKFIRKPDVAELRAIIKRAKRHLKIVTIALELKRALNLIRILKEKRVTPSIGHTSATYEEAEEAIEAGIECATHTFNAMGWFHHRAPGAIGAVLTDERVAAMVISDGAHISPCAFKLLLRSKGRKKVILVTDSIRNRSALDAKWDGKVYRLKDGTIAGSGLTMIDAVRNSVIYGELSLSEAVALASENPARALGLRNKGTLKEGNDADLVILDRDYKVWLTMVKGEIVYRRCAE